MKIYFSYLLLAIFVLLIANIVITHPKSEIRHEDFAERFSKVYFKRLDNSDLYPINHITKSIRFDKKEQYIDVKLRILYQGGVVYSLSCKVLTNMRSYCFVGIFGISFELPDNKSFIYEWREE